MKDKKHKKPGKKQLLIFLAVLLALAAAVPLSINAYVKTAAKPYLVSEKEAPGLGADCILVLGAGLKPDGSPSGMLKDRLNMGIRLYQEGAAPKLLLSGDHGQKKYDEVNAMKDYALKAGVPSEDIFMDHAGFSTYESMYRARDIFLVKKPIIVTQQYHQYRALYTARGLGLEGYGVVVAGTYSGQSYRDFREILARDKDFVKTFLKPRPTYLGDTIPISGSGLASHD